MLSMEESINNFSILNLLTTSIFIKDRSPQYTTSLSSIGKTFSLLPLYDNESSLYILTGYQVFMITDKNIGEALQENCKIIYLARCIENTQEWDLITFIITKNNMLYFLPSYGNLIISPINWNLTSKSEFNAIRISKIISMLVNMKPMKAINDGQKMILKDNIINNKELQQSIENEILTQIEFPEILRILYTNV
jgi:hypothetical protein